MNKVDKLHQKARDIMAKLNEKYNVTNELSLDEYLDEFRGMLIEAEIDEIIECLKEFDKVSDDLMSNAIAECVQMDIDRGVEPNLD
jgi:hypothetical protein